MAQLLTGTITWFNSQRKFGFIIQDNSPDSLFIERSRANGSEMLRDGDRVSFSIVQGARGAEVVSVSRIS